MDDTLEKGIITRPSLLGSMRESDAMVMAVVATAGGTPGIGSSVLL